MGKDKDVNSADCLFADAFAYFDQGLCYDEVKHIVSLSFI